MPDSPAVAPKPGGKVAGFFRRIQSRKSLRKLKDTSVVVEDDKKDVPPLPSTLPPKLELLDLPVLSGDFFSGSPSSSSYSGSTPAEEGKIGGEGFGSTSEADGGLASLLQFTSFASRANFNDRDLHSSTESTASTALVCSLDRQSTSLDGDEAADDEYGSASPIGDESLPTSPKTTAGLYPSLRTPSSGLTDVEKSRIAMCTRERLQLDTTLSPPTPSRREPSLRQQLAWHSISRRLDPSSPINRSFLVAHAELVSPTTPTLAPHTHFPRLPEFSARPSFTERSLVTTAHTNGAAREDIAGPTRRGQGLRYSERVLSLLTLVSNPLEGDASTLSPTKPGARPSREVRPGAKNPLCPTRLPTLALNDEELVPTPRPASPQRQVDPPTTPLAPPVFDSSKRLSLTPPRKPVLPGPLLLDAVVNQAARPSSKVANSPTKAQASWALSDSDDDEPLAVLKERSSPKQPHLKLSPSASASSSLSPSPSSSPISVRSRSLPHSPSHHTHDMQSQLLEAQQRAAQLEAELVRLQRRDERHEREKREREEAEREKARQRRIREQRRRSEAMMRVGTRPKGEDGGERFSKRASTSPQTPTFPTPPNLLGMAPTANTIVPPAFPASPSYPSFLPVPVLVPVYTPSLQASISSPDLRQRTSQQFLAPPSPTSPSRPPLVSSHSAPALDKRSSLQPPPPAVAHSTARFGETTRRRSVQPPSSSHPLPLSRSTPNVLQPPLASGHPPQRLPPPRSRSHPHLPPGPVSRR
ncbi:hypothetical protein NBRC10512_005544 [Rhodotorula toruloides]|uniref:RHTO0S09e03048g1_1 n=2 Tax=Rhodotorula toruloides TaxID=5286 RepID=A0A061B8Z3_RHOTO|nr:uncharacterized protein RHTO_07798 [Rhodotorula toruloides NP11]EMS22928.1 hypothetical protein RHTO_07798 [Rhodotorula toruloides NP11]CDR44358.1 RHTO0S09e03048g1_1 [Rhodotorula toruloides]